MKAKEFLMQAHRLNELIENDVKELENLRDLASRISTSTLGSERVQTSRSADAPFVKHTDAIIDMERRINDEICNLMVLKNKILKALETVKDKEERLLLTYRYVDNYSWSEISEKLKVSNRTAHRIHSAALEKFLVPK